MKLFAISSKVFDNCNKNSINVKYQNSIKLQVIQNFIE